MASGHKLYMWQYTKQQQGEEGAPPVALKTRRSLRAVHFHPLGLPLVLTAEVNDVSAPVTLPFGVTATPPPMSPPQPPDPMPGPSLPAGVPPYEEPSRQPSVDIAITSDRTRSEMQQYEWPVERRAPRRLSEVFRALMEEEREEELFAQLESSASLHASSAQTSASRQILGLTHHSHAQLHRPQGPRASSPSLSHRVSGGVGSLPHQPVPIRQLRPPSRPRSYHPLRHSIDADSTVSTSPGLEGGGCGRAIYCCVVPASGMTLSLLLPSGQHTHRNCFASEQASEPAEGCENVTSLCHHAAAAATAGVQHPCQHAANGNSLWHGTQ